MDALGILFDIIPAFQPSDLQTARTGDYVSLKHWGRCSVVLYKGAGTAGDDPVLTFQQAQDVAGTGVKNLANITYRFQKQAATDLSGTGTWTKVTQIASQTVTLNNTSAEEAGMYVCEIGTEELDLANGFDCLRVSVADTGANAQLGCAFYILSGPRFPAAPANLLSSII
jgi:hypothetical protein